MLYQFDKEIYQQGFLRVAGVDEAGRGPLAGPVCAAAVILPMDVTIEGINDSKKLTAKKRDVLYDVIQEKALTFGVAWATAEEIDEINILQASLLAMRRAVDLLPVTPDYLLIDGNTDPNHNIPSQTVIKGDATSASIAAASILAKVERDRALEELDKTYPEYCFAKHKGYPTKLHYEMLDIHGPCPAHRKSFLKKWEAKKDV